MKIAAGRSFYDLVKSRAHTLVPDLQWALAEPDGSWSESPDDCELLILAGDTYTGAFVERVVKIPGLRWAHTEDAGTDGFFYDTMRARGVQVTHSPGANAIEVAEFAFGLLLWSTKRFGDFQNQQQAHRWQLLGLEGLSDKTVLIVGLGSIGSRVATYAKAFDMQVLGIRQSAAQVPGVDEQGTLADLPRFLPLADFVVLAIPGSEATQNLLSKHEFSLMKSTATVINVARGSVLDLPALREALDENRIRQACLDVLPQEPWPTDDALWNHPRIFLTPHNAWSSPLYVPRVADLWLENLQHYVQGKPLLCLVR